MAIDASSLITTVGGATSNSYVTLQEFVDYADLRLHVEEYRVANADDRIRALVMAAKRLNRENWLGTPVSTTQALAWPRYEVRKPDYVRTYGSITTSANYQYFNDFYPTDEIPVIIKEAQYELALAYLNGFGADNERGIDQFQADGVSVKFSPRSAQNDLLPSQVSQLIAPLVRGNRLVRG
jgi:hypothetical protein